MRIGCKLQSPRPRVQHSVLLREGTRERQPDCESHRPLVDKSWLALRLRWVAVSVSSGSFGLPDTATIGNLALTSVVLCHSPRANSLASVSVTGDRMTTVLHPNRSSAPA